MIFLTPLDGGLGLNIMVSAMEMYYNSTASLNQRVRPGAVKNTYTSQVFHEASVVHH